MEIQDIFIKRPIDEGHNSQHFLKYFESSYELIKDEKDFCLNYFLKLKFKDLIIAYYQIERSGSKRGSCSICNRYDCDHIRMLINDVIDKYQDEIKIKVNEYEEEIKEEIRKENQIKFNSSMIELMEQIDFNDKLLVQEPVELEVNINLKNETIEHKVGRNKKYKIKNISNFLNYIIQKKEFKYGKELEFIHDISAFDKTSQKYILYLLNSGYQNSYYFDLKEEVAKVIFETYLNKYVYINENPFLVRLTPIKPIINVDKDYQLSISNLSKYQILCKKYLVDFNDRVIDVIGENDIIASLVNKINEFPNVSIEPVKNQFKYSVYLKYMDSFSLDKQIEEEFVFEDIDIKAYFDFDKRGIVLQTKLFKNDLEIKKDNLDKFSYKKYYQYLTMINNYGFVDEVLEDDAKVINFLSSDLSNLKMLCEVYLSESILNKKMITFTKPSLRINYNNNIMSIFLEESKYSEDEIRNILKAIRKKKKYVLLKENMIILNEDAYKFEKLVDDFNLDDENLLEEKERPIYLAFKSYSYSNEVVLDEYLDNMINDIKNFKSFNDALPKINGELRKYQIEGYNWLKILYKYNLGGILADDMGLGKTLQIITLLASIDSEKATLIICPKSLVYNWKKEIEKFAPQLNVLPIYGNVKERQVLISEIKENEKCIYLSSYDMVRSDVDLYENIEFDTLILDEAQFIKNVNALKTKSIKKIKAKHKFVLTGTPIENNIIDLWSIFDFLMPNYLPNLTDFKSNYEKIDNYSNLIYKKVAPFVLRRTKKEVLKDLPDKYERIVTCELEEEQQKVYDSQIMEARNILNSGGKSFDVLYLLTRLRQICVDPKMFIDNYTGGSAKITTAIDIIKERISDGHRLLVFSQFVKAIEILEQELKHENINYRKIIGDTSSKERLKICEEFNANHKVKVVLISLKAGGTGLNLIGADTVLHIDPWWNVAVENQATDRAHRIGQTKNVEVIKLVCENSIEQKVIDLQQIKKELFDKIISSNDSSITSITKEDLSFILN